MKEWLLEILIEETRNLSSHLQPTLSAQRVCAPLCSQEGSGTKGPDAVTTLIIFLCLSWSTEEWTEKQEE